MQISQKHSSMSLEDQSLMTLSADFLALLDKGQALSDVTFKVEDRHVFAHRCVLAARSPFFRMVFCDDPQPNNTQPRPGVPNIISVGIVGYDVFMLLLQFLYSGNYSNFFSPQNCGRQCKDNSCRHTHCSSAVEFGLDTMKAAHFFGLEQLSTFIQKHLAAMAEKVSVEDVMRILTTAHTQENKYLWNLYSKLVAKSGLSSELLQKHLPADVVWELEDIRRKSGFGFEAAMSSNATSEQKTKRMQKALDSSDVELVQLMISGEGLNLDKAFALHYAVSKCSRKVVKTLLDLGEANVNLRGPDGLTPLHIAAKLGDPEKTAMLLDHAADPHVRSTATGPTAMGIVKSGLTEIVSAGGYNSKGDQNRLRLCMELLEKAIVASTPPLHTKNSKVESGSPASILTGYGSSTLLPEESDTDFRWSMRRTMNGSNQGIFVANNDISSSFSHGFTEKVYGKEPERPETSDSISRLLYPSSVPIDFSQSQLQAESRSLTGSYSILDTSSLEDRPRKMPRLFADLKSLPVLREAVLKDFTNEGLESFKTVCNPNYVDEEVSSGWQLFLQERSEAH